MSLRKYGAFSLWLLLMTIFLTNKGQAQDTLNYTPSTNKITVTPTLANTAPLPTTWIKDIGEGEIWVEALASVKTRDDAVVFVGVYKAIGARYKIWGAKLASDGTILWQKRYDTPMESDAWAVDELLDGSLVVAGKSRAYDLVPDTIFDGYIMKLTATGELVWQNRYGGLNSEIFNSIQELSDGSLIASGRTIASGEEQDAWVIHLTNSGDVLWQKSFGTRFKDEILASHATIDNGIIVVGYTNNEGTSFSSGWIMKLDNAGQVQWQKSFSGNGNIIFFSVDETSDSGFIVSGYGPSPDTGRLGALLIRLRSDGSVEWQKVYSAGSLELAMAVQEVYEGGYVIAGDTSSSGNGQRDYWMAKVDENGNMEWQRTYGEEKDDIVRTLQVVEDGYVFAGRISPASGDDALTTAIVKLDVDGNLANCSAISNPNISVNSISLTVSNTALPSSSTNIVRRDIPVTSSNALLHETLVCGIPQQFSVGGNIHTSNLTPVSDVLLLLATEASAYTNGTGTYTMTNIVAGTYTLTPTLEGYTFLPPTRTVTVPPDATNVDFVACGGQELAERYAPIMHYHADELYRPIAVDFALAHGDLVHYLATFQVRDQAAPLTVQDLLKPEFNRTDRWIDLPGDESDGDDDEARATAYRNLGGPSLSPLAYARIYCPPTPHPKYSAAIQYWFFYYDNPWYLNRHEGDWEMVQVMLDHDQNPIAMGFSTHFTGVKRPWATINKQNTHPLVYVAEGGHGSYSFPARYSASDPTQLEAWWTIGVDDATTAMTPGTPIAVQMIPERPDRQSWLYFNGHWGSSEDILNDAPLGPRGRIAKHLDGDPSLWDDPIVWFNQLETYEDSRATTQGKIQVSTPDAINITITPHGGANQSTLNRAANAQDEAIESYVNPETGRRVVVVHQPDISKLYDVTLNAVGTTQPSAQVRLHFPDVTQGVMVAVTYPLPSAWGQNSKATVTVNQTNDLQLQVDLDGNGVTDQSITPSNVQTETVGFAQAPTLSIAQSGTNIQLTWSNGSTNQRYEVHRSHQPNFTPSAATLYQSFDNTIASYTDAGATAGNTNFYYLVRAKAGPQAADSNQVGLLRYPLNNSGGKYTLLTLPFSSSTIVNAATLATHVGNVGALLKWNPATQSFRFFAPPSSGDNFPVAPGDAVFVSINVGGPSTVAFVGNVTAIQHTLRPGGYNFLSLPHQRAGLTNAGAVAIDMGGVQALLAWNAATQSFRFFAPPNAGDNFALAPGDALIALLTAGGPTLWPASNGNIK